MSIRYERCIVLLVITLFAFASCKKNGPTTAVPPKTISPVYPVVDTKADVYMAGTTSDANNEAVATYWKNGAVTVLAKSLIGPRSEADAIAVDGSDVYIAGSTSVASNYDGASYWKNGSLTHLPGSVGGPSGVLAITISNGDVYIAGFATASNSNLVTTWWKNGVATLLDGLTNAGSQASTITVSGSDVYLAGWIFDYGKKYYQATSWKNGIATILSADPNHSIANGIAINGTDVYVVGVIGNVATLWKNGIATSLAGAADVSMAKAIVISGTDIYISGYVNAVATYWKNGVATSLTFGSPGTLEDMGDGLALNGADVFMSGGFDVQNRNALYWFNGLPVKIGGNYSVIKAVAVVPK